MSQDKIRVAVLFGGRSTEHEISIITGLQALDALDATRYEAFPVYIDLDGNWYTGAPLRKRENFLPTSETLDQCVRVSLSSHPGAQLTPIDVATGWFARKPSPIPVDVFFPAFHGAYGEDGCLQGLLEFIDAPYVGCGPLAAALGMNKHASKKLLMQSDVPVLPDILLDRREWDPSQAHLTVAEILRNLDLPVMVKPCNLGSSIAISAAYDEEQLMVSLAGAFSFDHQVLVEPLVQDMYELNIAVLNDSPPRVSAIERPVREKSMLTFEDKYMKNAKKSDSGGEGMASLQRDIEPQDVPNEIKTEVREIAIKAFQALDCRGVSRFDFIVDRATQSLYFNEVNTLPGSLAYYLWEKAEPRLAFTELLTLLIEQTRNEWKLRRSIRRRLESRLFR